MLAIVLTALIVFIDSLIIVFDCASKITYLLTYLKLAYNQ